MWCLICYILNCIAYVVGWKVLIFATLKVALGPDHFRSLTGKAFAYFMEHCVKKEFSVTFQQGKTDLFSSMKNLKSMDQELAKKNALKILEIGVGTGTNLEFYPAGSRLYCIDPNKEFEVFFRRACLEKAAHLDPDIRFVVERGESMRSVADGSVDVVVSTLVLCSVTHLDEVLHEVRRVLVPGGKFFFLEHVGHPAGTWRRRLQNALSNSGLWPSLYDGCVLNKPTVEALMSAGFSKVDHRLAMMKDKQLKPSSTPLSGPGLISPIAYGEATK